MKRTYSDEDLTAFLDGELDADLAAEIDAATKMEPDLAQRIEALVLDIDTLKTAYAPLLGVAQSRDLLHKLECANSREIASRVERPNRALRVASYAAVLIAGVALGWAVLSPKPDWRVEVAHYQALYVPDTLSSVVSDATRLQTEFTRAGNALGLDLDPLTFADMDGMQLRRAQVLGFDGAPLVQIAFTLADGTPVAFCILQQSGRSSDPKSDVLVGLAAVSWSTETHRFLAIGGDNTNDILGFFQQIQTRL